MPLVAGSSQRIKTNIWMMDIAGVPTPFEDVFRQYHRSLPDHYYHFGGSATTSYQLLLHLWEKSYESYTNKMTPTQWLHHIRGTKNPLRLWYDFNIRTATGDCEPPNHAGYPRQDSVFPSPHRATTPSAITQSGRGSGI